MKINSPYLVKEYPVETIDRNVHGFLPCWLLSRLIQQISDDHSALFNRSLSDLHHMGKSWVLGRLILEVDQFISNESVCLKTWTVQHNQGYAERDYFLFVPGMDIPFARAISRWLVVDMQTGNTENITSFFTGVPVCEDRAIARDNSRTPRLKKVDLECDFPVRISDIDPNKHVNNSHYMAMVADSVGVDFWSGHAPVYLDLTFRKQAVYGDVIRAKVQKGNDNSFYHSLVNAEDSSEFVCARSIWREI